MIRASGARGPGFNSRPSPSIFNVRITAFVVFYTRGSIPKTVWNFFYHSQRKVKLIWRGGGSNPRPSACEADALPLSYFPKLVNCSCAGNVIRTSSFKLAKIVAKLLEEQEDLNLGFKSNPMQRKLLWQRWDSNPRPEGLVPKTSALDHSATLPPIKFHRFPILPSLITVNWNESSVCFLRKPCIQIVM